MLCTVADVIDALGGPSEAAKIAGVGRTAVSNWKIRDERIPPEYFVVFSKVLEKRGKRPALSVFGFRDRVGA